MINLIAELPSWFTIASIAAWTIFHLLILKIALNKVNKSGFYSDTPYLQWLGVFVWGDALILSPFWILSSILFFFMPIQMILRYILVFFLLRSLFEVVYWLNHQAVKSEYRPPLFRRWQQIGTNEAAILYQLINMCQAVVLGSLLLWSFWW